MICHVYAGRHKMYDAEFRFRRHFNKHREFNQENTQRIITQNHENRQMIEQNGVLIHRAQQDTDGINLSPRKQTGRM